MTFPHLKLKNITFLHVGMKKGDVSTPEIEKHHLSMKEGDVSTPGTEKYHLSMKEGDVFDGVRCESKKKFGAKDSAALCTR
jgi:hypothetical protein